MSKMTQILDHVNSHAEEDIFHGVCATNAIAHWCVYSEICAVDFSIDE